MNQKDLGTKIIQKFMLGLVATVLCYAGGVSVVRAQETSTTTVSHGPSSYETNVTNATVAYVAGNDLVLKFDDGRVEHLKVPDSDKFTVNGQEVGVQDLQPGTTLTQTITTKTTPRFVKTVTTINGQVMRVFHPNSLILRLDDGSVQRYSIPAGQRFNINGKDQTAFELRKGMNISATVVTDEPQTVVERTKSMMGQAPKPNTPTLVGALLIAVRRPPAPVESASNTLPNKLPKTGSIVPLIGLLGLLSIGVAVGLRLIRQRTI